MEWGCEVDGVPKRSSKTGTLIISTKDYREYFFFDFYILLGNQQQPLTSNFLVTTANIDYLEKVG